MKLLIMSQPPGFVLYAAWPSHSNKNRTKRDTSLLNDFPIPEHSLQRSKQTCIQGKMDHRNKRQWVH